MDANATGVAVRIDIPSSPGDGLGPMLHRLRAQISRPVVIISAAVVALLAAMAPNMLAVDAPPAGGRSGDIGIRLATVASLAVHEVARLTGTRSAEAGDATLVAGALPAGALAGTASIQLFDGDGFSVGAFPPETRSPRRLADMLHDARPAVPAASGVHVLSSPNGAEAVAAIRETRSGYVAVVEALPRADRRTLGGGVSTVTLAIAFGLAALGAGCLWHGSRAREASSDCARLTRRLETSLARARCGLWDWDLASGRIFWSASMYALLGYEPRDGDLSIGELGAILHPDDLDLRDVARRISGADCVHVDQEFRARSATGRWVWLRARADVVQDPQDGSRRLVGVAVDVTQERCEAERKTVDDARLRDAIEAISEAFVLWDADNKLVVCNSKFRDLHDLSAAVTARGTDYAEMIEAVRPSVVENRLAGGYPQSGDARTIEKQLADGRWLQINERRTRDGGFVSVGTDITPLKRNQDKLVASERRLLASLKEQRRSRREAQVQAQQLAELAELYHDGKDRAEAASRAKTEFLAKMSHELRTPLNAIIGFADMMQGEVLGPIGCPRYAEYSRDIHASGHKLMSTIDSILTVSEIEAGRVRLSLKPVDAGSILGAATDAVAAEAAARQVSLVTDAGSPIVLRADADALRTVLVQLLRNAVQFAAAGTAVRLTLRRAGGSLNIFVADAGTGIPAEFLDRLGRPFEQAEAEECRSGTGFGLGLAIARALSELHGGRLRIRSEQGVGTIALVHLPLGGRAANDSPEPWRFLARTRRPFLLAAE